MWQPGGKKVADLGSCEIFFLIKFKLFLALKTRPAADTILHSPPSQPLEAEFKEESPMWWVSKMTLGTSYTSQLITPTAAVSAKTLFPFPQHRAVTNPLTSLI